MVSTLQDDDPSPFNVVREGGESPFLLSGDHAGFAVPKSLQSLGLPKSELCRHIGVDIGIATLGDMLSEALDATFISQPYSRLVIDCNRHKGQADSIPTKSDGTFIPANLGLSPEERMRRERAIFDPYHAQFSDLLDQRHADGRPSVLVALHSFTPHHSDFPDPRPWHISVLYNRDARLALPLLGHLRGEADLVVGENEPYVVSDELDYGIPVHGELRGILSVEIEIRQDTLTDVDACQAWCDCLVRLLPAALNDVIPAGQIM
ncbi:MAG: N-formylglutamate amidohydrolase [Pseudomonadota bacterium]